MFYFKIDIYRIYSPIYVSRTLAQNIGIKLGVNLLAGYQQCYKNDSAVNLASKFFFFIYIDLLCNKMSILH